MLLQMPIWWALWRVLTGAIELRHAPWIFWIHDLSVKDPYLHSADRHGHHDVSDDEDDAANAAIDPAQQKMMKFMPLMFAAIFFTYASGLESLYVHEQPGRRGAAILSEPHAAAALEQPIQE